MVYLLEPALAKLRMEKLDGIPFEFAEKKNKGFDFSREDVPSEIMIEGSFVIPDVCLPTREVIFVSERFREALQRLAPGCCRFFPLKVNAPANMKPEPIYCYLDVTARAQTIDWEGSETRSMAVPNSVGIFVHGLKGGLRPTGVTFRSPQPSSPSIWREAEEVINGERYYHSQVDELMTDELWHALSREFPGQLVAKKLGCG